MKTIELEDIRWEHKISPIEAHYAANLLNNLGSSDDLILVDEDDDHVIYARNVSIVLAMAMSDGPSPEDEDKDFCEEFEKWTDLWDGPPGLPMVWEHISITFGDPSTIVLTYKKEEE
jgi:hypothetical protein